MHINWESIFVPQVSLLEMIIRGTLMYLSLIVILRLTARRQVGTTSVSDLLLIILIADAAQNGMSGDYRSVPEGIVLCLTIMFWAYAVDWLAFHLPWFQRLLDPPALPLVEHGQMIRRNMRQELVTREELMTMLREHGVEELKEVKSAFMEADGKLSVLREDGGDTNDQDRRREAL